MLPPEQYGPRNTTRVLALQEEGLGFAVLEAEDFAVAADVELALNCTHESAVVVSWSPAICRSVVLLAAAPEGFRGGGVLWKVEEMSWDRGVPCQGRSSDR